MMPTIGKLFNQITTLGGRRKKSAKEAEGPIDRVDLSRSEGNHSTSVPPSPTRAVVAAASPPAVLTETEPITAPLQSNDEKFAAALRRRVRQEECRQLMTIEQQLRQHKLEGPAFQQAAMALSDLHSTTNDEILLAVCSNVLHNFVQGKDNISDWILKGGGPVNGPAAYLSRMERSVANAGPGRPFQDLEQCSVGVGKLSAAVGRGAVPQNALRAAAHLGHTLWRRASDKMKDEDRQTEPVEVDRAQAETCFQAVENWWRRGQIEVLHQGTKAAPGQINLRQWLEREYVQVSGSTILLQDQHAPAPAEIASQAEAFIAHVDKEWKGPARIEPLLELHARDSRQAAAVMAAMVNRIPARCHFDRVLPVMARVAERAVDNETVRALLDPHLDQLFNLVGEADRRGRVVETNLDGGNKMQLYGALAAAFPQRADERFVRKVLGPLLMCDEINTYIEAAKVTRTLWQRNPSLVASTMRLFTSQPQGEFCHKEHYQLMASAVGDYGWRPDALQTEWLAARLFEGHSLRYPSVLGGGDRPSTCVLPAAMALVHADPHVFDGVLLPDGRGQLTSVQRAMLHRVLDDPEEKLDNYSYDGGNPSSANMRARYDFALTDTEAADELIRTLSSKLPETSSLNDLDLMSSKQLIAASLTQGDHGSRLRQLLAPYELQQQHSSLSAIVDVQRAASIEQAAAQLKDGKMSAAEGVALAESMYGRCFVGGLASQRFGNRQSHEEQVSGFEQSYREFLQRLPAPQRETAVGAALARLGDAVTPDTKFSKMTVAQRGLVQTLHASVEAGSPQFHTLTRLLEPALQDPSEFLSGRIETLVEGMKKSVREDRMQRLRTERLSAEQRDALMEDCKRWGRTRFGDSNWQATEGALQAYRDGLVALEGFLPLQPSNAVELYHAMRQQSDLPQACRRFERILGLVGGEEEHFGDAVQVFDYVESNAARGVDREKALEHAVACLLHGVKPADMPRDETAEDVAARGRVERGGGSLRIGGLNVPVRT